MRLIIFILTGIIVLSNIDLIITQDRVEYATEEVAIATVGSKYREISVKSVFRKIKFDNVNRENKKTISHLSTDLGCPSTSLYLKNRCFLL